MCDWAENIVGLGNNGIPIPRSSQGTQLFLRPAYCDQFICDSSCSPSRNLLVPPNSLNQDLSQLNASNDASRSSSFSPYYNNDSPLIPSGNFDMDMEIKMEPIDELIDINIEGEENDKHTEDNLLDNVNFEDLLMTEEIDSTTCLDPQHSSPAAMATVHPDEVLGMIGNAAFQLPNQTFLSSGSVPVKTENAPFDDQSTSFPRHGIGWKTIDSYARSLDTAQPYLSSNVNNCQPVFDNNVKSNFFLNLSHNKRRAVSNSNPADAPQMKEEYSAFPGHDEMHYTQLQPVAGSTGSAFHDLLLNSPSTPDQPQHLSGAGGGNGGGLLHDARDGLDIPIGQSVPGMDRLHNNLLADFSSRLSSSAPVNNFPLDSIWQRREPRQHLLSTGSLAEEVGDSTSSLSTGGGIVSPLSYDFSIDEEIDSDSENEHCDSDSDNESLLSEEMTNLGGCSSSKRERHFWQYNVQAKGPKGQKVNITPDEDNPYNLAKIMDPVFSPLCSIQGIKHSGKARRGDGNDLTPSPRKLVNIGIELNKLNKRINEMTPVSELPSTIRSKSRKEKNKLASRACRLKKKAQHEANKIKLFGIEQEHKSMLNLLVEMREHLMNKVDALNGAYQDNSNSETGNFSEESSSQAQQQALTSRIEKASKIKAKQRIAGYSTEFVNKVIENCRNGDPMGGLNDLQETLARSASFDASPTNSTGLEPLNYNNQLYT